MENSRETNEVVVVELSPETLEDLRWIYQVTGRKDTFEEFIDELIGDEAYDLYQYARIHDDQEHNLCPHSHLKIDDNGLYRCTVCHRKFEAIAEQIEDHLNSVSIVQDPAEKIKEQ
jgi:hypothetical protein